MEIGLNDGLVVMLDAFVSEISEVIKKSHIATVSPRLVPDCSVFC
jgi:hypothetical protein